MKRTFTLFLAAAFLCMSNVMAQVSLKFERTGTDAASVTVSVVDAEGVAIEGATATLTSDKSFKTTGDTITSSILCPDANGNAKASIELEFTVNGLPEGFKFDKVGLHIHALNGGGSYQETDDNKTRQWNVDIDANGSDFSSFDDIDIAAGIDGANKLWETQAEASVVAGDPFVLKLTITSGTTNIGCYFGLSEIVLSEEADPEVTVDLDMTSKVGTSKDAWNATGGPVTIDGVSMPEKYETTTATLGDMLWQTVTGLENGTYTVELWANARYTSGREFDSPATDGQKDLTYLYANDVELSIPVVFNSEKNNNTSHVLEGVEVTDGTLKMGMTKKAAGSNWHTIQIKSLTLHAANEVIVNIFKVDLKAALDEANAVSPKTDEFTAAIATAQAVYDNSSDKEEVLEATATLKEATKLAILMNATEENPVLTDFVVNGTFDSSIAPWVSTTSAANKGLASNKQDAFTGNFFENWNASNYTGKIYQVIENIPNGLYELSICAFVETFDASAQFVYANGSKVALTTGTPTAYTVRATVTNNTLEVGFKQTAPVNRWCGIDNVSLTYLGLVDVNVDEVKAAYDATKAEAEALVDKGMSADALSKLNAALAAEVDVNNSEALVEAQWELAKVVDDEVLPSNSFYEINKTAYDEMCELMESTNVYTAEAFLAYKSIADSYTTPNVYLDNPATIHGWRASVAYDDFLLSAFGLKDFEGLPYINTWSKEGEEDGSDFKVPFFEYYGDDANSLATETMTATMTGLVPDGFYSVEAWVRVSAKTNVAAADATGITLSVGEGTPVDVTEGVAIDGSRRSHGVFTAYGYADAEGNLTINFNVLDGNNVSWLSFKNLKYAEAVAATEEQKQALSEAIAKAEANILGFAVGEYAPYTNVDALKALAAAKAVDVDNTLADDVDVILQALEAAVWTANTTEMNAIYDGSFEYAYSTDGNVQPIAWHGINNHDNATDIRYMWDAAKDAGLLATSTGKALFTKYNAFYGTETGYTMPLKENSVYELTFIYGGWSDCKKDGYVTITGPDDAVIALSADRLPLDAVDGYQNAASWKTYTATFTTGAAGNYVLGLRKDDESKQSQYVYGDFNLRYVGAYVAVEEITVATEKGDEWYEFSEAAAGGAAIGNTVQLVATVTPDDATFKDVTWNTNAPESVITISETGLVTLVGYTTEAGYYTITATADGVVSNEFELNVDVPEPGAVTSIELNHTFYQLEGSKGDTLHLTATVNEDAIDKTITWSSDNEELVTVDAVTGVVTITATTAEFEPAIITATASNGLTAMCYLYVSAYEEGAVRYIDLAIKDGARNQLIGLGATVTLEATIDPVDATDQTLQWSSSEPDCVTVSQEGVVEVIAPFQGGVFIYATASNGVEGSIYLLVQAYEAGGVQQITLNTDFETLNNATTYQLVATITPNDDTVTEENKVLTWESDNTEIATVDQTGKVTFVGTGWVTITVTAKSGASAECGFNVKSLASTDIKAIETLENAVIYDLSGRRVEKAVKGLYIVNGRKVLVK